MVILDVQVPTAPDNPYPILHIIPKLLETCPDRALLVISMYTERALVQTAIDAGASEYIVKDDSASQEDLATIVTLLANGGVFLSKQISQQWANRHLKDGEVKLTPKQLEMLSLCASYPDWSRAELARRMNVSYSTVRNTLVKAYLNLGVHTLAAAIAKARQLGLIAPPPPTSPPQSTPDDPPPPQ